MKRCLLLIAMLLGVHICIGLASADYMVVKIDLNAILHPPAPVAKTTPIPGTVPPNPGTLKPPAPVYPPAKGVGGKGGKKGAVGGFPKQQPYPVQPQPYPVQPGAVPAQPGTGAAVVTPPVSQEPPMYVYAYLEIKTAQKFHPTQKGSPFPYNLVEFDHKLGDQKVKLLLREQDRFPVPATAISPSHEFKTKFTKLQGELKKDANDSKKLELVIAAKWALQHGLMDEFDKCITELKTHDPKHAVVAAVEKARDQLKKTPAADDPAAQIVLQEFKKQGYGALVSKKGHYTMLTNMAQDENSTALAKKLDKLENVYTTFFMWFAIQGQPRLPPAHRLVVVVVDTPAANPADFLAKHKAYDYLPMVGSGFTVQRDNVIIMASRRTDYVYEELLRYNQVQWVIHQTNMDELLTKFTSLMSQPRYASHGENFKDLKELPVLQALALCQKAMDEENDIVTLSHEGMRQLIAATSLLPPTMQTAEWARFGLASFFEVPPEAVYPLMAGPNWQHLTNFKALVREQKLEAKDARDVLLKTIGDDYLHHAYATQIKAQTTKEDRAAWNSQAQHELEWARATAWSLMYFLAGDRDKDLQRATRQKNLQRYFDEINGLPRDTDFEAKILQDCFFRAFGLTMPDAANPGREIVDLVKVDSLAAEWLSTMEKQRLPIAEYEKFVEILKHPAAHAQQTVPQPAVGSGILQPGQPGYPGVQPQPGYPQPGIPQPKQGKKGKG